MRRRMIPAGPLARSLAAGAALLCLAGPALGQETDPIGALLDRAPAAPQVTAPPAPAVAAPPPVINPRPTSGGPIQIDDLGRSPDGPLTPTDLNYESRLRASFASAQGMQGPLDGRWMVQAALSGDLYQLQLVDTAQGRLEGAWRDPRRAGAPDASGFIDSIQRSGGQVVVRFQPRPGAPDVVLTLTPAADGGYRGELDELGVRRVVVMRRN